MMSQKIYYVSLCSFLVAALFIYTGCDIDSADSVSRNVPINVNGLYRNNGSRVVSQNTGAAITALNIVQDGSRLQAIDNNGIVFKGNIGTVEATTGSGSASFTMTGRTTAGAEGVMTGSISISGQTATLRGTWAEPAVFGNLVASATVGEQPDPRPTPTNTVPTNTSTSISINTPVSSS